MTPRTLPRPPARAALLKVVNAALDEMKAANVKVMDVRDVTDVSDCMIVASGNSDRHVRSIADRVVQRAKEAGFQPFGVEGARDGEWVLVDLNDVIVHVMLPRVREFYGLEGLWDVAPVQRRPAAKKAAGKAAGKPKKPGKPAVAAKGKGAARPAAKAAKKKSARRPPAAKRAAGTGRTGRR